MSYIYMIRNTVNNKAYIGQTINKLENRINDHFSLTQPRRGSRLLKMAIHKYGRNAFAVEILHDGVLNIFLDDLEISEIKKHNTLVPHGYNLDGGGNTNKFVSNETRRKMSEASKGRPLSPAHRKKISEFHKSRKRKPFSLEVRRKMSQSHKGKPLSPEHRKKLSEARRKPRSPEHCRKLSEAKKGKPRSPETRWKLSEAHKGKKHSPETRQKMSLSGAHPDRPAAFEILNSLPESMPLIERRKTLRNKFPEISKDTIYGWVKKWSETS